MRKISGDAGSAERGPDAIEVNRVLVSGPRAAGEIVVPVAQAPDLGAELGYAAADTLPAAHTLTVDLRSGAFGDSPENVHFVV